MGYISVITPIFSDTIQIHLNFFEVPSSGLFHHIGFIYWCYWDKNFCKFKNVKNSWGQVQKGKLKVVHKGKGR